jgi:hypothetical protein
MIKKISVDLTKIDMEAGKHWLSKPTPEELKQRLDDIRRKNREKYLANLKASRS